MSRHRYASKPSLWIVTSPAPTMTYSGRVTPPQTPIDSLDTARRRALFESPPPPCGEYYEEKQHELGSGAWSRVVRGRLSERGGGRSRLVAIKKPCYPDAEKILREEAKILSFITNYAPTNSVVQCFGFDPTNAYTLMECVDGPTLAQYCRQKRREVRSHRGEPVIGLGEWLDISMELSTAFLGLKTLGVIHGDVTWYNILLRVVQTKTGIRHEPVVIDFSSGHLKVEGNAPPAVSATTVGFCSPELLDGHTRRPITPPLAPNDKTITNTGLIATYSSDLYGLGMTLLSAAIGAEVYENAGKYAGIYARQGQPLDWVRNGDERLIVGVRSVVSKVLSRCFGRDVQKRIGVEELQNLLSEEIEARSRM